MTIGAWCSQEHATGFTFGKECSGKARLLRYGRGDWLPAERLRHGKSD